MQARQLLGREEEGKHALGELRVLDVLGGYEQNYTIGANWYINRNIRLMFNAIFADVDLPQTGQNDKPRIYQGRIQIVF